MPRVHLLHHIATILTEHTDDCWAASLAMVMRRHSIGGTDHVKALAAAAHVPLDQGTMPDSSVRQLAAAVRLGFHEFPGSTVVTLAILERFVLRGPVAAFGYFNFPGVLDSKKHVVAIYGLTGDGTARGTKVHLIDPSSRKNPLVTDWEFFERSIADITFLLSY